MFLLCSLPKLNQFELKFHQWYHSKALNSPAFVFLTVHVHGFRKEYRRNCIGVTLINVALFVYSNLICLIWQESSLKSLKFKNLTPSHLKQSYFWHCKLSAIKLGFLPQWPLNSSTTVSRTKPLIRQYVRILGGLFIFFTRQGKNNTEALFKSERVECRATEKSKTRTECFTRHVLQRCSLGLDPFQPITWSKMTTWSWPDRFEGPPVENSETIQISHRQ